MTYLAEGDAVLAVEWADRFPRSSPAGPAGMSCARSAAVQGGKSGCFPDHAAG
ncbi:MAG: hypothetical protein R3F11_19795 [Verrucomicrobiales bacterium]